MAAVSFPVFPETSRTGAVGFPELPALPLGRGKNGNGKLGGNAVRSGTTTAALLTRRRRLAAASENT